MRKTRSQVESQVGSQVLSQVRSQVWSQGGSQVWSQVGGASGVAGGGTVKTSSKRIRRKPQIGDWFALRSPAGSTEYKIEKIEKIDGRDYVSFKGGSYAYDASRISEDGWVSNPDAVEDEVALEDFKAKQRWMRSVENLWHESSWREHEIQEALGVDFLGESKRPHKKMKGSILMKSSEETHQEVLAAIKKLKKNQE